jgi:hypothetical protein
MSGSVLVEYRCRAKGKGCLLLRVSQTRGGPEFYVPGHRLSDSYTRIRDLDTGGREYDEMLSPPRAPVRGRLDESAPLGFQLLCNHVSEWVLTTDIRGDMQGVTPGRPTRVLWPKDTVDHS